MNNRPDRPLVVKCQFDRWNKRITFSSARNCTYILLRHKIEQCFSLSASGYAVTYKDDDGEVTDIRNEMDLSEAIQYFQAGSDDPPLSSAASILSGRSFGSKKITLRVHISVDYDGPSLSDTGSIASIEEYGPSRQSNGGGSEFSFSLGAPSIIEPDDDDSVTVSSKDTGGMRSRTSSAQLRIPDRSSQLSGESSWGLGSGRSRSRSPAVRGPRSARSSTSLRHQVRDPFSDDNRAVYPTDPSAVFERLRLEEEDNASSVGPAYKPLSPTWLQDQNDRARAQLGVPPEPTESDSLSLNYAEDDGKLALERDDRGKYYYTYNVATSSGASQAQDQSASMFEEELDFTLAESPMASRPRPNSRHLNWLASQQVQVHSPPQRHASTSSAPLAPPPLPPRRSSSIASSELPAYEDIPPELLPFIPTTPPVLVTGCSECNSVLDSIRYVCSTCGEKDPVGPYQAGKGKGRLSTDSYGSQYPPQVHRSSHTLLGSSGSYHESQQKLLSSLPNTFGSDSTVHLSRGFELCSACIESAGLTHAIEAGVAPGSSPTTSSALSPSSPTASQWRRLAPKEKGKLRHAYHEKIWGHGGWKDIEQDEASSISCSACGAVTALGKSFKCASCKKYYLCRACYSLVHNVHPSHAFLVVPDHGYAVSTKSDSEYIPMLPDPNDDEFLKHPGVKCAHCLQDIVGARFHCAICDAVDICANCESAGLPGNLDSADGGHNSSHIMIKIPIPLETTELQIASKRAIHLWTGRDAANVVPPRPSSPSKSSSALSGYAKTVIGGNKSEEEQRDHRLYCNGCAQSIAGVRYQCGNCPSKPTAFNLCAHCEARSYMLHDPTHVFFKLPRRVDRPIESSRALLPKLYRQPVGPGPDTIISDDPQAYLRELTHSTALCDLCMTCIQGAWFRCVYCGKDLCDACEELDNHNYKHFFMVFKAPVDMHAVKVFTNLENPSQSPPVINYPVYL
ncbi:hypothetical protein CYLTODRAFT_418465 [Cylindrobasidium torrendii FP15055 ss-10]|uniref:ZZ-type domain-containing protein n=1 Tax=Cylindrobasidium torrendii FP15055 ss-10 TaxID=1314674 RepID=A0A0D7BN88_9AGAR|nr:hypothetical protein CYLTODRAFT_418465 [Cylindrobasidium torrendii FP15055 ss-10]